METNPQKYEKNWRKENVSEEINRMENNPDRDHFEIAWGSVEEVEE